MSARGWSMAKGRVLVLVILVGLASSGCGETEEEAYEAASREDSRTAYEGFLEKFPGGAYRSPVEERLSELEKRDHDAAVAEGTVVALSRFLDAWPRGRLAEDAGERHDTLLFERAVAAGTAAAFESAHGSARTVRTRARLLVRWEEAAFEETISSLDAGRLRAFLARFPEGRHAERARGILRDGVVETRLCDHRKKVPGGFSHRWAAYIVEPEKDSEDRSVFVDLNGERLGPYERVSPMLRFSPDGRHVAFAARKDGTWRIVLDGTERSAWPKLGWARYTWSIDLEGDLLASGTQAAVMKFSPTGDRLACITSADGESWSLTVNGEPGPTFDSVSTGFAFVDGDVVYAAWRGKAPHHVWGGTVRGPFEKLLVTRFSSDGKHAVAAARTEGRQVLLVDGEEVAVPGEIAHYVIGPGGEVAYAHVEDGATRVVFRGEPLPGSFDEVNEMAVSPDGRHVAFWARRGKEWSVITDTTEYPGFGGPFFMQCGGERYHLLWGPDSKHLAYYARGEEEQWIFVLDGERFEPAPRMGGLALSYYPDGKGNVVGLGLAGASGLDRRAAVACCLEGSEAAKSAGSAVMVGDRVAYVVTDERGQWMKVGEVREGPYDKIASGPIVSGNGEHLAYLVRTTEGVQVVVDGRLRPGAWEALHRPSMVGESVFAGLGVRDGFLHRVAYLLGGAGAPETRDGPR
jgi:hypothetical protein